MMKKYRITIRTYFGSLTIDDIEAETEDEAIAIAEKKAQDELDCAKIDEVYEYKCYHENHEWKSDGDGGNLKYCNDCKGYV